MDKKDLKNQKFISVAKFLRDYYELDAHTISTVENLSHKELKEVCRDVYGINLSSLPFDTVTQENINCGDVILVNDTKMHPAPYKNPQMNYTIDNKENHLH